MSWSRALCARKVVMIPVLPEPVNNKVLSNGCRGVSTFKPSEMEVVMSKYHWVIADRLWQRIGPLLPDRAADRAVTARDNHLFLEAVLWKVDTGALWRDLPDCACLTASVNGTASSAAFDGYQWQNTTEPMDPGLKKSPGKPLVHSASGKMEVHNAALGWLPWLNCTVVTSGCQGSQVSGASAWTSRAWSVICAPMHPMLQRAAVPTTGTGRGTG